MSALGSGGNTDVLINIRLLADKGNAAVANQTAKIVSDAANGATASWKTNGSKQVAVVKTTADQMTALMSKSSDNVAVANQRANEKMKAGFNQLAADHRKQQEQLAAAEEKRHQVNERAVLRLETKVLRQGVIQERMALGMVRGAGHAAHAIGEVAEGLALIGITSEKDAEKLAKMFIGIEGVSRVFQGTVGLIETTVHMTTAWERALLSVKIQEQAIADLEKVRAATGIVAGVGVGAAAKRAESSVISETLLHGGAAAAGSAAVNKGFWKGLSSKALSFGSGFLPTAAGGAASVGMGAMIKGILAGAAVKAGGAVVGGVQGSALPLAGGLAMFEGWQGAKRMLTGQGAFAAAEPREHGYVNNAMGLFTGGNNESFVHAVRGWWQARGSANASEESFNKMDEATKARHEAAKERDEKIGQAGELSAKLRHRRRDLAGILSPHLQEEFDSRELFSAQMSMRKTDQHGAALKKSGDLPNFGEQLRDLERLKTVQENIIERDKEHRDKLKEQRDLQREQVAAAYDQITAAKELVKEEKARFQDTKARFAQLTSGQRATYVQIMKDAEANGGVVQNRAQAMFLNKLGFGGKVANKFLAGTVTKEEEHALGVGKESGVKDAKDELNQAQLDYIDALEDEMDVQADLKDAIVKLTASIGSLKGTEKRQADTTANQKDLPLDDEEGGAPQVVATIRKGGDRLAAGLDAIDAALAARDRMIDEKISRVAQRIKGGNA